MLHQIAALAVVGAAVAASRLKPSDSGYKYFWAVKYQWNPSRPDGWSLHSTAHPDRLLTFRTKKEAERWLSENKDPVMPESVVPVGPIW